MKHADIQNIRAAVEGLAGSCLARSAWLATAESCTGGLVAKVLTDLAGSSQWFDRGFVTYSNEAKVDMLSVRAETLTEQGAVSEQVVKEMAAGAIKHSRADFAVALTGIAGPSGGAADKPVGTVWIAWASKTEAPSAEQFLFDGDREAVRVASTIAALAGLQKLLDR